MLQAQGRLSTRVVGAFRAAERELGGLGQRLQATDATFLDVGTGTGWLAIAIARAYPRVQVVGIDIHEPALALARRNIADEQLTARIDVQRRDVVTVSDHSRFDAIWLPLPFLPADIVSPAWWRAHALRPDGWLLAGTYGGFRRPAVGAARRPPDSAFGRPSVARRRGRGPHGATRAHRRS